MTWMIRLFLFITVFNLDVRVRAEQLIFLPMADQVMLEPQDCLLKQTECAVKTGEFEKFLFNVSEATVTVGPNTLIKRTSDGNLRLYYGEAWIKSQQAITVETEFGNISLRDFKGVAQFWLQKNREKVLVRAGEIKLFFRSKLASAEEIAVPAGYENWFGKLTTQGSPQQGVLRAIEIGELLSSWAKLYSGSKSDFENDVIQLSVYWHSAVLTSSDMYQQNITRKLASIKEEKAKQEVLRKKKEAENRELRLMFREKNFLNIK